MDHPCEKCGSPVEDGRPFCPHCRAPQVRVQIVIAGSEAAGELTRVPDTSFADVPEAARSFRLGMSERSLVVQSAIKAGLLGIFIVWIPFLGALLTGALAIFFYRRASGTSLNARWGSRLGAAAGTVSFALSAVFTVIQLFVFHAQQRYQEDMLKVLNAFGVDVTDPNVQSVLHQLSTPSGVAISLFFGLILTVALAAIGGALAAAMFRPRPPS